MKIPRHVAFIADGNRRWAREHSLPIFAGHKRGEEVICNTIIAAKELGIKYVSFFIWSHENDLKRSDAEKKNIYDIVEFVCKHEVEKLNKAGVYLRVLGNKPSFVNKPLSDLANATINTLKDNTEIDVSLYFGYGSRLELLKAVRECATDVKEGKINVDDINEDMFRSKFYAPDVPDPDIVI